MSLLIAAVLASSLGFGAGYYYRGGEGMTETVEIPKEMIKSNSFEEKDKELMKKRDDVMKEIQTKSVILKKIDIHEEHLDRSPSVDTPKFIAELKKRLKEINTYVSDGGDDIF